MDEDEKRNVLEKSIQDKKINWKKIERKSNKILEEKKNETKIDHRFGQNLLDDSFFLSQEKMMIPIERVIQ